MHAIGHVGSAALPLFLAADKRTCAEHARFFVHEYDWGFTERQTLHRMQEAVDRLKSGIDMAKAIISARTPDIPPSTLEAIGGGSPPVIINPAEAKKLKIVSEICELSKSGRITTWLAGTTA